MKILKKLIAKIIIPKKTNHCYKAKYNAGKYIYKCKFCHYLKEKNGWQYCRYLKKELSIQDAIKDCNINKTR